MPNIKLRRVVLFGVTTFALMCLLDALTVDACVDSGGEWSFETVSCE